jgi:dihydroorotate dehydrogenase (NAD+) catalytic subunit
VIDLAVQLAPRHATGLVLKNPVMPASGTFGYGTEYARLVDVDRLGALVTKAVTLRPRRGNGLPRLAETPSGMLNSIGLQNPGARAVIRQKTAMWARLKTPVIVNIAGDSVEDYGQVAELLDAAPGVAALEINISCPNVRTGGMAFGIDCATAAEVTAAVKMATSLPVIVKLTPNVTDIVAIAKAVVEAGADAISLINTLVGMVIDVKNRRPFLGAGAGGLSGPAIRPVALRMVYQVARAVDVPIIGIGGIASADDALQFLMAGASAVQVGTATFVNPSAMLDIIDGLERFLEAEGIQSVQELVGVANEGVKAATIEGDTRA